MINLILARLGLRKKAKLSDAGVRIAVESSNQVVLRNIELLSEIAALQRQMERRNAAVRQRTR